MAITAFGCGNGGGGDDGGDSDAGGDDGGGGVELCMDNPAEACAGECAFEPPADVNCSNACANIDTVCGSGCAGQCEGVQPGATCIAACEGTKALRCTNLVFGCYATNDTCNSVGNCVNNSGN